MSENETRAPGHVPTPAAAGSGTVPQQQAAPVEQAAAGDETRPVEGVAGDRSGPVEPAAAGDELGPVEGVAGDLAAPAGPGVAGAHTGQADREQQPAPAWAPGAEDVTAPQPAYQGAAPPPGYQAPQPGYQGAAQVWGPPHPGWQPGHPAPDHPGGAPAYGTPVGPPPDAPAGSGGRSGGRLGRSLALAALGLLLAGGGGVAGGLIVHQADEDRPVATSGTGTGTSRSGAAAAPVIDRSSLADIVARVQPSVVSVNTGSGGGSGVVLSADGYVLTNNHVVAGGQGGGNDRLTVAFTDGKSARATVVGTDPKSDLAVIKASGVSGLTAARLGDSAGMRVGDSVFAIGSPLGLEGSVTSGIISALDRTIQEGDQNPFGNSNTPRTSISGLLQTDAAINPGNSGGALVNLSGEVIGINTAIATAGQGSGNIGVGFAIPSNRAREVAQQLIKGGKVSHPQLGVAVSNADGGGALVSQVNAGGPAEKAGIRTGDVITKAGDRAVRDREDLISEVQSHKVGDKLEVTLTRDGKEQTVTVTLGEA